MSILEEIQNAAVDSKSDLGELLRKCKVLAARLGSKPLEDWLIWESNGYPTNVPVPEYRIWSLEVLGDFVGIYGGGMKNARIPIGLLKFIPKETKQFYERWECRQSVGSIEELLKQSDNSGKVSVGTGHLAVIIGDKLYQDKMFNCVHTWAEFGRGHLVELANSVRNRVLDFALAVEKENPNAGQTESTASANIEPAKVTQIFHTTVYGGAASIVGTATKSPITFNIGVKDFASLEKALVENGIPSTDIAELKEALESEPAPSTRESFGPRVSSWMGKMTAKAAEGSWNIGIGAAGGLLADLIAQYYGLK